MSSSWPDQHKACLALALAFDLDGPYRALPGSN
jgi:hypothetical protein